MVDPEIHIGGCRILHKRTREEGLCDECKRWRDWHEYLKFEYRKVKGEDGVGGGRYILDGEVGGLVEGAAGEEEEEEEDVEEEPVEEPPVDYSTMSALEKHDEYERICATYRESAKDETLSSEEKQEKHKELAAKLRRLGEIYYIQSRNHQKQQVLFQLPQDQDEQYIWMFTRQYVLELKKQSGYRLWTEAHQHAMRHSFRHTENFMHEKIKEEERRRDLDEQSDEKKHVPPAKRSIFHQSKNSAKGKQPATAPSPSPEELQRMHEELLETHRVMVKMPAELEKKRAADAKKKKAQEEEKKRQLALRAAVYFGEVADKDTARLW